MNRKVFSILICIFLLLPLCSFNSFAAFTGDDRITVVLDPGHGGKDSGSLGTQYESYYNLKVAQACADALKKNGNFNVKMTRNSQSEELSLAERCVYADSQNADIIVSIHFNSSVSSAAHGIEVYSSVLPRFDLSSLAKSTADKLSKATGLAVRGCYERYDDGDGKSRYYWSEKYQWDVPDDPSVGGLSDHYGIITWAAKFGFPGMIIEHAYLSNPGDLAVTNVEENLRKMGEADAEAIIEYYTNHTHSYNGTYTQDYPVSCFSAGKKSIHCSVCQHRKNITTVAAAPDPNAHLWISEDVVQPTCYSDGSANMYCRYTHNLIDKGCEQFEEHTINKVLPRLNHNYAVTFSQPLTHTQDGITKYACSYCGDGYTETVTAEGHSYKFLDHVDPTCTTDGGDRFKCATCGDIKVDPEYALGHSNTEIGRTDATCEGDGEAVYQCNICDEITKEVLESPGHSYISEVLSTFSCESDGETVFKCTECGDEHTEKVTAEGHRFEEVSRTEASCEINGVTVLLCSVCGASHEEAVPAYGHAWDAGVTEKSASLFSAGSIRYTCTNNADHISVETVDSALVSVIVEYRAVIIIVAVIVLIGAGFGIFFIIRSKKMHGEPDTVSEAETAEDNAETDEAKSESENISEEKEEDTDETKSIKSE